MFQLITPLSYWVLTILWLVILGLYLVKLRQSKMVGGAVAVLLSILAIDAFRTVFESVYFGLYFNSLFGLLPKGVHTLLNEPALIVIPKVINVVAGLLVLFLLIRRWVPREIREREEWITALQNSEEHVRNLLNSTAEAIYGIDMQGNCTFCNPSCLKILGYENESELLGQDMHSLIHHTYPDGAPYPTKECFIYKAFQEGKGVNVDDELLWRKDKTSFPAEYWSFPLHRDEELIGAVVTFLDITERKKSEEALEESEREYRNILNNMEDTFYRANQEGRIVMASPSSMNLVGYSPEELVGMKLVEFYADPDRRVEFLKRLEEGGGKVSGFRAEIFNKGGGSVWVSANARYWKDTDGNILGVEGTIRDITAHTETEYALRQSQKMEAVGQLTGGVAHDFNNILNIVMGNLEILQNMVSGDEKALDRIEKALKGTNRGAAITKKLLNFSRIDVHGKRLTSINQLIESQKYFIAKSLTASIKVETHLADDLWTVSIDPGDLEDTILNLSLNARDAMPDGGILTIETANKVLDDSYVKLNPESEVGEFVMIAVSDNGMGMTEETKEKVFDPFFTTKEQGKGTGLGLSMVYGFVQRSGGHLKVYSEVGKGTTIRLYLPRAHEEADVDGTANDARAELPRGTETILVVDDEEGLLDIAVLHLKDLGYKTLSATSGKQAIQVLGANKGIDLMFSDVIMSGNMDGYQLALAAQDEHPGLKILLTSGFTKKRGEYVNSENKYLAQLTAELLGKPYNQSELAIAIRSALDDEI